MTKINAGTPQIANTTYLGSSVDCNRFFFNFSVGLLEVFTKFTNLSSPTGKGNKRSIDRHKLISFSVLHSV